MLIEGKISRMKTGTAHLKTKSVNQRDMLSSAIGDKKGLSVSEQSRKSF